ncbi:MAG: hypothetical protein JXR36_12645 [Bacteroidales bacterium]|nr:hypothetical protein [Bacteroidales bacterium]
MKSVKAIYGIVGLAFAATITIVIVSMFSQGKDFKVSNPELFKDHIKAYTGDVISKNDVIAIQFTDAFMKSVKNKKTSVIKIYPKTDGAIEWKENNILEFKPSEPLLSGTQYHVVVELDKLSDDISKETEEFVFRVHTKHQLVNLNIEQLVTTDRKEFKTQDLVVRVNLHDSENDEKLKTCFNVMIDGENKAFELEKSNETEYYLNIKDIKRTNHKQKLLIKYDGGGIESKSSGELEFEIPPTDEFKILDIQVHQYPEQYVQIIFSDPIKEDMLLSGLIDIGDVENLKYIVVDNNIKVIPSERLEKSYELRVGPGVKNINGKSIGVTETEQINFKMRKPEILADENGVILPGNAEGQVVSFQAVNIRAVDVRVLKIFENNVLQFLQENDLNGSYELNRVAKVVKTKTISLEQTDVEDFSDWNKFYLNLSDIIEPDPGAIYRIEIGFRKENAIYPCSKEEEIGTITDNNLSEINNSDNWEWFTNYTYSAGGSGYEEYYYDEYDYYYDDDYSYDYSYNSYEDPCNNNYYGYSKAIKFNILATDIGIIGKMGKDNKIFTFVTDLKTTKCLQGAVVNVYDYQQQVIGTGTTDNDGKAIIEYDKKDKPYFIVATYNNQKSYLKVQEYGSLTTSEFDVSGSYTNDGARGFIYTERGVWRPGDSIYVGFILNEMINPVPVGHPIVFEVKNPQNQEVYREVQTKNEKGFHVFKFKTEQNDPTGYYYATFTVGGKVFSKSLMIETIRPNRLSVELELDKEYLAGDGSVNALISARWLHGAVAADLEADVTMTLEQAYVPFEKFKKYSFYNQMTSFDFNTVTLFTGRTNENGEIKTNIKFDKLNKAPGVLKAYLTTKVYEKGGNFSTGEKTVDYYPYSTFIGVAMSESDVYSYSYPIDEDLEIDIVAIDRDQKLSTETRELEVSVYLLEYSWWYDYQYDGADYISSNYNNAVDRTFVDCKNGKAKSKVKFEENGDYLIVVKDLKDGHTTSMRVYASYYGSSRSADEKAVDILEFKSEKDSYNVGEMVEINVPTGNGKALVSIENSTSVLKTFWQESDGKYLKISFETTEEMAPNVYVNISFIQEHGKTYNDRPMRMYGIVPVLVENPGSHINPVINMPDELLAESKVRIQVREESGKAMTYTLAMVDEGLLNLTSFKTPDPWSFFYSKQALGVRTWDIYKWVIGAFEVDAGRMISIGGGGEGLSPEDLAQAIRFKPMVRFIGPFSLPAGGINSHEIQLPQYIGSVRTMVIAAEGDAFGSAEKTTPVKKPLMVLGSGPRKLGTDETFKLPVTVFAMKDDVKNVEITVKTNGLLSIDGANAKVVNFSKQGENYLDFDLKSGNKTGVATIEIIAKSGSRVAKYNIELDVKHANAMATDVIDGVSSGDEYALEFDVNGIEGTNSVFLELYNIPPMNLEEKLDFLVSYPHGCLEQTVSAAFPQLYIENLLELDNSQKADIQQNINACLNKLSRYQMTNGGFAYWPGANNVSEWATNYVGHFIIEAEKVGYTIPGNIKTNWLKYQKEKASKWTDDGTNSQLTQAYRLYTLAIAGQADRSAMNRLKESKLSRTAIWRLALAYAVSGKESIAKQMIINLSTDIPSYFELSGTFGSATRDKAMILETLIELGEKEKAFMVLKEISEVMGSSRYTSTQTTAYALLAASKFVKKYPTSDNISCTYTINGKSVSAKTAKPVYKTALQITEGELNQFTLKSENEAMVFVRIIRKGIPETGSETAASSNINMDVRYSYLNGNPIDVSNIPQGTDFVATVTLQNISGIANLENVALSQIFPSGWEIINSRMLKMDLGQDSYFTYQDIRDDRVLTYFNMNKNYTYTYRVLLNASFEGKYYLPSVMCETMYDDSNYARNKGMWVNVTK